MSNDLKEKEKQVEISRLEHSVLEYELKILKKYEEIDRLNIDLSKSRDRLKAKKEGKA
jgi:hypothetical protein